MFRLTEAFRSDTWEVWMEAGIAAKLQPPTPAPRSQLPMGKCRRSRLGGSTGL